GARHAIVHQRAGEQLPGFRVVDHLLPQRLARALRDAALDLALDDGAVDDAADVVDAGDLRDRDRAGVRIDLNFDDLRAVRPGRRRGRLRRRHADAFFRLLAREFRQADRAVGAADGETAIAVLDVPRRRFEDVGGKLFAALNDFMAGRD